MWSWYDCIAYKLYSDSEIIYIWKYEDPVCAEQLQHPTPAETEVTGREEGQP